MKARQRNQDLGFFYSASQRPHWFLIAKCKKTGLESWCGRHVKVDWRDRILEVERRFQRKVFSEQTVDLLITSRPPKSNQMLSFIFMNMNIPNSNKVTCIIEKPVTPDSTQTFFSDFALFLISYNLYDICIFKKFTFICLLTM